MAQDSAGTGGPDDPVPPDVPQVLDELDLALINALQVAPRVAWAELGPVLGVDPVTLARRWRRLVASGSAWMTCYPGPGRGSFDPGALALVEVDIEHGRRYEVAERLSADAHAITIEHLTGARDLLITVGAPDPASLTRYVQRRLAAEPGITATRTHLVTRLYQEGSAWRLRSLDARQRRSLAPAADELPRPRPVTELERRLMLALGADARLPVADLARVLGVSAATAARRLAWLMASGHARFRCEVAHSLSGRPVCTTMWLSVPPAELDDTALALAAHADVRMCAAVTGTANLCVVSWLRSIADVPAWEAELLRRFPRVAVNDRAVMLEAAKLIGRLLTPDGRSRGYVPLDVWGDPLSGSGIPRLPWPPQ
ncbi:Lrp/AsnC family transcriptional regulator [Yinghuangia soli]|uniref:Lrp/AsnC family transcriptional regulator n=1 Tax=Yinghuangia soli TaxID=2908204 RepID=A0AA41Q4I5_9ACTN|nr:Lrp/AsnC family transcriptional regulator [Yinghuangia soli]MCF2530840.1 Lrp/AsnC family transcriptional regulator [Yinghuangia soli]